MMQMFEFCDFGEIEAFVLAPELKRAQEIFQQYLLARGEDGEDFLFRDFQRQEVDRAARSAIDDAFAIGREGLVVSDAAGHWAFIMPVGAITKRVE